MDRSGTVSSSKHLTTAGRPRGGLHRRDYRELRRRETVRLILTYLAPIVLLAVFFSLEYRWIVGESRRLHLLAIAEHQANTLDLFLRERLVNVTNLIRDPQLELPPSAEEMQRCLDRLKRESDSFVDVGFFDLGGEQLSYAGPYPALAHRDYGGEQWFASLMKSDDGFVITDIYLGFRGKPHFTIAVRRNDPDQKCVVRATLDPRQIYEYVTSLKGAGEVNTFIVNRGGGFQLTPQLIGETMGITSFVPPSEPTSGTLTAEAGDMRGVCAYSWLPTADWALIAQASKKTRNVYGSSSGLVQILIIAACVTLMMFCITWMRAKKLVASQMAADQAADQLEHAAKLASVGELAAGIAHEINNPLAVITEEAGLARDLINPEFEEGITLAEMVPVLERIEDAAFRCRDITRKLLQFVRKTEVDLREHDVHSLIDDVVDGLVGHEMAVSGIELVKAYGKGISTVVTDANQVEQVLLNLLNNAVDAIEGGGRITIATSQSDGFLRVSVSDTGRGMSADDLKNIFLPFFTTKGVGKGTGLGLSVSYGIVKSLGGRIEVHSTPGRGSTFVILLPV